MKEVKNVYIWFIYYRNAEGQILKHITDSQTLHQAELTALAQRGREILKHFRQYCGRRPY